MDRRKDDLCDQRILLQLPGGLKLAVTKAAKADGRSTNNFIRYVLQAAVDEERTA
jgi:hypothetical protein